MKVQKEHYVLACFVILFSISIHLPCSSASPTLRITVRTDESSYFFEEEITVYGEVTSDGVPISDTVVALEVHDAANTSVATRTPETDTSGIYTVQFALSSEASPGTYTIYVTCTHNDEKAVNNTSFELKQPSILVVTVKTTNQSYTVDDSINIYGNVTLNESPLPEIPVALQVRDPNNTSITMRVVETDVQGNYELTFGVPAESMTGPYAVFATAGYKGQNAMDVAIFRLFRKLYGDITGDGRVDIRDITVVAMAFGSRPGDPNWNPFADLNNDGVIDIRDITIVALEFGKTV